MATNPTANLDVQNWYADSLAQACGASDTTIYLNNVPSPTEGYLIIDPNNTSTREVIHYTSKGAGTVVLPGTGDRGVDGTSAASHAQGTAVVMNYTSAFYDALKNGYGFKSQALATTGLFANNVVTSQVLALASTFDTTNGVKSFTNAGTGGGTFFYVNLGGLKQVWGLSAVITITTGGTALPTIQLPTGFFNTIQSATFGMVPTGSASQFLYLSSANASIITLGMTQNTGGTTTLAAYVDVKGT
jgi:hypothetical protein